MLAGMSRRTRLLVSFGPLLALSLACSADSLQGAAFEATCVQGCVNDGTLRSECESYCGCGYRWARDNDRLAELERAQTPRPGQRMAPVLEDLLSACGGDLWDDNFRRGCVQECAAEPTCRQDCDCLLRELRGPGPREASTRFLLQNVAVDPPTAAGEARQRSAQAACGL